MDAVGVEDAGGGGALDIDGAPAAGKSVTQSYILP